MAQSIDATYPEAPLFTIVMPAYRARATIAEAIASVFAQTEPSFELIIVDDGSPDDVAAVAAEVAGGDPRVRIIRQANAGPAAARNHGIAAGTGVLIAFLDADDRWAAGHLAAHAKAFAAAPELGVSFGRIRFYDAELRHPGRSSAHVARLRLAQALGENAICTTSNLTARRATFDAVGGFDTALFHAEDQEWVARLLAASEWQVRGLDAVLVDYRTSAGGLSADLDAMRAGWRAMVDRVRIHAPVQVARAEGAAGALHERYLARRALRTGQPAGRAVHHLAAALRLSPAALFANDAHRTVMTMAGTVAACLLPAATIRAALAR